MIETKDADKGYMPYPLRYKEQKQDNGKLLVTTIVFVSGYLLFIGIVGLKLGFL